MKKKKARVPFVSIAQDAIEGMVSGGRVERHKRYVLICIEARKDRPAKFALEPMRDPEPDFYW